MSIFESAGSSTYNSLSGKSGIRTLDPNKLTSDEIVYNSFSGADITAVILMPNEDVPLVLGELQTFSYSIHRENTPVRTLGHTNVRGFVKGPRTIAGSMIFYQFNQYAFYRLKQYMQQVASNLFPLADMLPPFDMVLSFSNEYGAFAKQSVYGLSIVDEGSTMSVDDMVTEQTFTYMARGISPLVSYVPNNYERIQITPDVQITKPSISFTV